MSQKKKYPNLENIDNSCWVDAAIVLISNNKTFKKTVESNEDSYINKIITVYEESVATLNNSSNARRAQQSKLILRALQKSTLKYLKDFLKFKFGEPESAFCALLNLIYQDKSAIKEHLNTTWVWHKQCFNCKESSKSLVTKPIITLSKLNTFNPEIPTSLYTCTCKKKEQMKMEFVEISDCIIFHFENGAGKGKSIPLHFFVNKREYHLTSLILYEESAGYDKDHFVTWIRQPFTDKWLECNDLNDTFVYFSTVKPKLKMKNMYLMVYETFDDLSKTKCENFSIDDMISSSINNIELIDLSVDKKPLLNSSTTLEMSKSLPSNGKSPKQKGMEKPKDIGTKIYEVDEVQNIVKPSKDNVNLYENMSFKDKKTSIVKPIESLSGNETPEKTDGKDFTKPHGVNQNAKGNSVKATKVEEKSKKKSADKTNYDKKKLAEYVSTVVENTYYAFFDSVSSDRIKNTEAANSSSTESSSETKSEAEFRPTTFSDIISAVADKMADFSLSDFAPSNAMDSDNKK